MNIENWFLWIGIICTSGTGLIVLVLIASVVTSHWIKKWFSELGGYREVKAMQLKLTAAERVIDAVEHNTGAEPSLSIFQRALDDYRTAYPKEKPFYPYPLPDGWEHDFTEFDADGDPDQPRWSIALVRTRDRHMVLGSGYSRKEATAKAFEQAEAVDKESKK